MKCTKSRIKLNEETYIVAWLLEIACKRCLRSRPSDPKDCTIGIPRCRPEIKLNDRSIRQTILGPISGTHPQDSQQQTGYRNRFMNAGITWTIRSYAQF